MMRVIRVNESQTLETPISADHVFVPVFMEDVAATQLDKPPLSL